MSALEFRKTNEPNKGRLYNLDDAMEHRLTSPWDSSQKEIFRGSIVGLVTILHGKGVLSDEDVLRLLGHEFEIYTGR